MVELGAQAIRWVDDEPFPGVVGVQFTVRWDQLIQ